jgi:PAS domain S-box-containing protein
LPESFSFAKYFLYLATMIASKSISIVILGSPSSFSISDLEGSLEYHKFFYCKSFTELIQDFDLLLVFEDIDYFSRKYVRGTAQIWALSTLPSSHIADDLLPENCDVAFLKQKILHFVNKYINVSMANRALMQLANSINNSVAICDPEGVLIWTNAAFESIYGYTRKEFVELHGENIFEFSREEGINDKIQDIVTEKVSVKYVSNILTKKGQAKSLQTTLSPVFEQGNLKWIVAIESDITDLKESEKLLEERSESLKALTEAMQDANQELQAQRDQLNEKHEELALEKQRTDELLHNILPEIVAHQLKKGKKKPKRHKSVTVMFADFKGFTKVCKQLDPEEIVNTLDELFSEFDRIVEKHFIEKIKTIGDAYMCAGGMPMKNNSHPVNVVMAALEIQQFLFEFNKPRMLNKDIVWECRIGAHSGEVFAGVVGEKKFAYDIWGDTVNLAARMETAGAVNTVNISDTTYEMVKDYFVCVPRGEIDVKNVGKANMFFVLGLKDEYTNDPAGVIPNETFNNILRSL